MTKLLTYVIPMQKQRILLPQSTVAEIIPYEPLQRVEDTPDWFLGLLGWRGVQVPVSSFEMLTVERASFSLASVSSAGLVIIKGLNDQDDLPYHAMVAQTTPRLVELTAEMLFETGETPEKTETARVRFEDDIISIPDLDYVESALRNILIT
ncbi:MAG: chemotaxis protein CheW [Gammaproteobacteria bacterium]|nr:chemotaxis protein CheW [Gammaproteobacteria bacterium]